MLEFRSFSDWHEYLQAVRPMLSQDIAANNMFLGSLEQNVAANPSGSKNKIAAIYQESDLVGAVLEKRDRFPLFSKMEPSVAEFAVSQWIDLFGLPKGMFGPLASTVAVVDCLKRTKSVVPKSVMRQMAYELLSVTPPATVVPGRMRLAERSDFDRLVEWSVQFVIDCRMPEANSPELREGAVKALEKALSEGTRFVWDEDGVLKSMAAKTRVASFGTSVSYVYTPREARGKGYASHLVAQLSQQILDGGAPRCMLFTDADNPTSNAIYQRIGYRHVADFMMVEFPH